MPKSKIFLYLLLSFLAGVLVASVLVLPGRTRLHETSDILKFISGFVTIIGISFLVLFWRKNRGFLYGFFILMFAFGIFWYQRNVDLNIVQENNLIDKIISNGEIRGIIADEPEFKNDRAKYVLNSGKMKILIQAPRYPEYGYGNEVLIKGKIEYPKNFSEDFDWKSYLAKDDIYLTVYNPQIEFLAQNKGNKIYGILYKFKNRMESIFKENLAEPHTSLLAGITLGSKSGIPEDVYEKFKETGTAHIVALSGYNISVIALAIMFVLGYFTVSRDISFWISLLTIVMFVLMTGASPSVMRAAVMGILVLIARREGRMYTAKNALVFAGAIMVFLNPKILRFDAGFQLSFLATLGLILIYPKLEEKLKNTPELFGIKKAFMATLSAQIFVLPLIFYQFGTISWISSIVNILILPAVPIAMFLGFLGAFLGLIWIPIAKIFLWPAWLFLEYILEIVRLFS
ncbi:MAG: ComEC/Rec2-related protein [Parcubacteria group bacterium GW2011_GWE2_37_8]|nr:MAG: ComEC/Rec2-related protein [Parcubacteria group bacterium GW2011_GWE2_37_8]